ncbi:MAG: hypothetical protein JWM16_2374, partial [Verrucomicrobiales bacterium]|nr:hypothetical protein [Verrucomicrobiales bacterium]
RDGVPDLRRILCISGSEQISRWILGQTACIGISSKHILVVIHDLPGITEGGLAEQRKRGANEQML